MALLACVVPVAFAFHGVATLAKSSLPTIFTSIGRLGNVPRVPSFPCEDINHLFPTLCSEAVALSAKYVHTRTLN
jgi:hypothetical protein